MGIRVASSQHNLYDKRILWKWKIEPTIREKYKLEFAFYQYILPGHINEIPQKISTDMPEGMYYHAIYHQYRGDLSKALDLYSQSLKGMNTKTFDNALLNLFYTIALLNDSTIESKKHCETYLWEIIFHQNDACPTTCPLCFKWKNGISHRTYSL